MEKYIGKSVYKGTAIGPINVLKKSDGIVKRQHVEDVAAELQRLEDAKKQAQAQLGALYEKALQEVGEVNAQIFEVHQMMLEDEDYQDAIHSMIETEELNAEYAVAVTGDNFAEIFANMDDEYMQARSADVKDISNRLIRNLSGEEELDWAHMEPSIIVADDLTPSETVQMDKRKILAFVTVHGSTNSHTAILARMMNIPALIGVRWSSTVSIPVRWASSMARMPCSAWIRMRQPSLLHTRCRRGRQSRSGCLQTTRDVLR